MEQELRHHGIIGQKWGVRRYQNADGTLTAAGRKRYGRYQDAEDLDINGANRAYDLRIQARREDKLDHKQPPFLTGSEKKKELDWAIDGARSKAISDALRVINRRSERLDEIFQENDLLPVDQTGLKFPDKNDTDYISRLTQAADIGLSALDRLRGDKWRNDAPTQTTLDLLQESHWDDSDLLFRKKTDNNKLEPSLFREWFLFNATYGDNEYLIRETTSFPFIADMAARGFDATQINNVLLDIGRASDKFSNELHSLGPKPSSGFRNMVSAMYNTDKNGRLDYSSPHVEVRDKYYTDNTRSTISFIGDYRDADTRKYIKYCVDEAKKKGVSSTDNELRHHGIIGQKWGKRNGPPYPLDASDMSKAEKKAAKAAKYVKTINTKTQRDNESKDRNPNRLAIVEKHSDKIARRTLESSKRSDERWRNAGRADKVENMTYEEAKGLTNIREGSGRRTLVGYTLYGLIGGLAGSSRGAAAKSYVNSLERDERQKLLSTAAGFKDPGRALAVVDAYRMIDYHAKKLTPAERDHYFDLVKAQLNT